MGGLCGFFGKPDPSLLAAMASALTHRSPRPPEIHTHHAASFAYFRRDLAEGRPSWGAGLHSDDDGVLVISGLLTDPSAVALGPRGLLRETRKFGANSLCRVEGDFVAASLLPAARESSKTHTGCLVRECAGARTIYYAPHQGRLLFACEPKAIWSVPGFPRRLRPASLAQYLAFSFVPGAPTMLEGLYELPAGHLLTWDASHGVRVERFFHFEREEHGGADGVSAGEQPADDPIWVARFRDCLAEEVRRRLPRDESPAVFLSGGLDSSVVVAEVVRQSDRPVDTYALHFGKKYPHELEFARAVAERCGTRHREMELRPRDFLPRLRQMVWYLDDPIGDPVTMPNMELARRVSAEHREVFNGEGGDPCFGGPKNIPMMLRHWYGVSTDESFRERAYLASYRRSYEMIESLLLPEWRTQIDEQADLDGVLTPFFQCDTPRYFLNKLTAINIRLKGAHLILPKVERMLAASGVIPLAPLFSAQMIRLSFQMPPALKLAGGVEKIVLKRAYQHDLPKSVIDRPKSGMRVPVHFWFQGELRRYARHVLSPRHVKRAGIFDPRVVKNLLDYNLETRNGRYGLRLWMLLTLEIWRRIVVEGESV
jgi:asparagine synthase (glutamine-hydrolysing)